MAQHTPGPWTDGKMNVADLDGFKLNRFPISGGGYAVAAVWAGDARRRGPIMGLQDMHKANARLIAAAPDGYALAKRIIEYFGDGEIDPLLDADIEIRGMARALVAKAEGR